MGNSIAPGSSADVNVKVTALTTNPNVPVTYKTIILKKNLVNGVNTLTQAMINDENIKYVIKYDYVLGENITIRDNCILEFDGGSISGAYTLTGNSTKLIDKGGAIMFNNVMLSGSFNSNEFILNKYVADSIDYVFSLIEVLSGSKIILTSDYTVNAYSEVKSKINFTDGSIYIDGNGHTLSLYNFYANSLKSFYLKDITINAYNDIESYGIQGPFHFSAICSSNSIVDFQNVKFLNSVKTVFIADADKFINEKCSFVGTYPYLYNLNKVEFAYNDVKDSPKGFWAIETNDIDGYFRLHDNTFYNCSDSGIILTGDYKYNCYIENNILVNVGKGYAEESCINIHPGSIVQIRNNKIVANPGAWTLDIDGKTYDHWTYDTDVSVENNILKSPDDELHNIALVVLKNLTFKNNEVTNAVLLMGDTINSIIDSNRFLVYYKPSFGESASYFRHDNTTTIGNTHQFSKFVNNYFYSENLKFNNVDYYIKINNDNQFTLYANGNIIEQNNQTQIYVTSNHLITVYGTDIVPQDKAIVGWNKNLNNNVFIDFIPSKTSVLGTKVLVKDNEGIETYRGWVDNFGNPIGTKYYGTTSERPTEVLPGTAYFDTDLGKVIYATGTKAAVRVRFNTDFVVSNNYNSDIYSLIIGNVKLTSMYVSGRDTGVSKAYLSEYLFAYLDGTKILVQPSYTDSIKLTSCYIGAIGDNYSDEHSNTTTGFTTTVTKENEGSITWVDATGTTV